MSSWIQLIAAIWAVSAFFSLLCLVYNDGKIYVRDLLWILLFGPLNTLTHFQDLDTVVWQRREEK